MANSHIAQRFANSIQGLVHSKVDSIDAIPDAVQSAVPLQADILHKEEECVKQATMASTDIQSDEN
jgi:hypothetical protein